MRGMLSGAHSRTSGAVVTRVIFPTTPLRVSTMNLFITFPKDIVQEVVAILQCNSRILHWIFHYYQKASQSILKNPSKIVPTWADENFWTPTKSTILWNLVQFRRSNEPLLTAEPITFFILWSCIAIFYTPLNREHGLMGQKYSICSRIHRVHHSCSSLDYNFADLTGEFEGVLERRHVNVKPHQYPVARSSSEQSGHVEHFANTVSVIFRKDNNSGSALAHPQGITPFSLRLEPLKEWSVKYLSKRNIYKCM